MDFYTGTLGMLIHSFLPIYNLIFILALYNDVTRGKNFIKRKFKFFLNE